MRYLNDKNEPDKQLSDKELVAQPLSADLQKNIDNLHILLQGCSDAVFKEFNFGKTREQQGFIVYFDGLVDRNEVELNLLKSLMLELDMTLDSSPPCEPDLFKAIQNRILSLAELHTLKTLQEICTHISSGDTVLLIDGYDTGLVAGTRSLQTRGIQSPENEVIIRGPKESFTEIARFNTALLRRRLKSTNFKIESLVIGRITKTDVFVGYIAGIAPPQLVEQVKERLTKIDIDGVLDTGYLEEYLEDNHYTIFSQIEYTERPDRICGHLLEGRVFIMLDGSPMVLVVPTSFPRFWIAAEDYYERYLPSSIFRIMRFLAFWVALLLPSLFVAAITYHQEMLPTPLYLTIAATREGIPFPAFLEALLLEMTFELLREAGLRLPRAVGPAVSIVGALIIGDAAVKAGLVSTPMVVVVAFTGIASFIVPSYNAGIVIRIARFGFLILAASLGLIGIMFGLLVMLIHMSSLSSFGMPYLSPVAPYKHNEMSDIIVRRPWFANIKRPYMKGMRNEIRQKKVPAPPEK